MENKNHGHVVNLIRGRRACLYNPTFKREKLKEHRKEYQMVPAFYLSTGRYKHNDRVPAI